MRCQMLNGTSLACWYLKKVPFMQKKDLLILLHRKDPIFGEYTLNPTLGTSCFAFSLRSKASLVCFPGLQ